MAKVLFVMTAADHWTLSDGTLHPTGFWAEEFVAPYEEFTGAGYDVVVATPGGKVPVVDEGSLAADANGGQDKADVIAAKVKSIPFLINRFHSTAWTSTSTWPCSTQVVTGPWKTWRSMRCPGDF